MSELVHGQDSGPIPEKTKRLVAFNSGGKCYYPNCGKHLTLDNTNTGECAHIIPRKVGQTREDWTTPLEDRRKPENLIYLCDDHHKVVDNKDNEVNYPTSLLKRWKADHETLIATFNPSSSPIPSSTINQFQKTIQVLGEQLSREAAISTHLLSRLLENCETLLKRRYLDKADILISQAEVLLSDSNDKELCYKLKTLKAQILWKQNRIPESKKAYLELLQDRDDIDVLIDYIEICRTAPEPGDQATAYEAQLRKHDSDHPRIRLLELFKKYRTNEHVDVPFEINKKSNDSYINAQLELVQALLADRNDDRDARDKFIDRWEDLLPSSPRPNFFRIIFSCNDFFKVRTTTSAEVSSQLEELQKHEQLIHSENKDPLSDHDHVSLLLEKLKLYYALNHFSAASLDEFQQIRDELIGKTLQGYFDKHSDRVLIDLLSRVFLSEEQWGSVINFMALSNVVPSDELLELIFTQAVRLELAGDKIGEKFLFPNGSNFIEGIASLEQGDVEQLIKLFDDRDDKFKIILIQSIADREMRLALLRGFSMSKDGDIERAFFITEALSYTGQTNEALTVVRALDLDQLNPEFLSLINTISHRNDEHQLTIETGKRLLRFDFPVEHEGQLHGVLAVAYRASGDDGNAYNHSKEALQHSEAIGDQNTKGMIGICCDALGAMGKNDEAAKLPDVHFGQIKNDPEIGVYFADLLLRSNRQDKTTAAMRCLKEAFRQSYPDQERLYLGAFMALNELSSLGAISSENKPVVDDGLFIQIHGLEDAWFYVGKEADSFDAIALEASDTRHQAVIQKSLGDRIDWPADRYASSATSKTVNRIVDASTYFCIRAHEAMHKMAESGQQGIWAVGVLKEDGSVDIDNLVRFHEEQFRSHKKFFDGYCEGRIPFSMLCTSEGSLQRALSRIHSEKRGFVRCNDGTNQSIQQHYEIAQQVVSGQPFFIDSLTALMFCEAGLLGPLAERFDGLHIATSVIKSLRDIAAELQPSASGRGRMGMVGGRVRVTESDQEKEQEFRGKLIAAADLLDQLPNKILGRTYKKSENPADSKSLCDIFPNWMNDTINLADENACVIVSDDFNALHIYKHDNGHIPAYTNSFSLVRVMFDSDYISQKRYLEYFSLLSSYRYHLLPLSGIELEAAVLHETNMGIVTFSPKNIGYFTLSLTLSAEYGVNDDVAARLLIDFFLRIILRDDVTEGMAEDVFSQTIVGAFADRETKIWGRVIVNVCKKQLERNLVATGLAYKKLSLLERQLARYAREFNPIIQNVPSLLKIGKYC